jgi:hypothetical protein
MAKSSPVVLKLIDQETKKPVVIGIVQLPYTEADAKYISENNGGIPYYGPNFNSKKQAEICNDYFASHPELEYKEELEKAIDDYLKARDVSKENVEKRRGRKPGLKMKPLENNLNGTIS